MPVRFAVCMAAYNGMKFIDAQIDSILHQQNVEIRLFISVDKSTDGTESHLAERALSEPRISLLSFGHRFGGAAPNFYRLLREVNLHEFDYLSLADQDDLWRPDKLWRAHCLLQDHNATGYSSNVTAFWPSGRNRLVDKAQPQRSLDFMFEAAGPGCTYVLKIDFALSFQQFVRSADERLIRVEYHDWLIYAFARARTLPWIIDKFPSMKYRQHERNQIGVNTGWRPYWLRVKKMLKGHGFEQSLLIADLVNASASPVVRHGLRGGRLGYLWLALHATQCRRRGLDQVWFFVLCILFFIAKAAD